MLNTVFVSLSIRLIAKEDRTDDVIEDQSDLIEQIAIIPSLWLVRRICASAVDPVKISPKSSSLGSTAKYGYFEMPVNLIE